MTAQVVDARGRIEALERKIDALSEQMAYLADEARIRQMHREAYGELVRDLSPVASDAMALATRELEAIRQTADLGDLVVLMRTLIEAAPRLQRALAMVDALGELADDAMPLTSDVMVLATDQLGLMQQKGYFEFARAGLGVVDRVVAGFSEQDVEALGDNVVTILNTVKEITQPEMLVLLQRMIDALQRQQYVIENETAQPPSVWALLKKMRDPDVRRGINRALTTLGSVTAETGPEAMAQIHQKTKEGDA